MTSDNAIEIRDASGQVVERTLHMSSNWEIKNLDWSPDGQLLAVAAWKYLIIWDINMEKPLRHWEASKEIIDAVDWNPDGAMLASSGRDGLINLWDGETGRSRGTMTQNKDDYVRFVYDLDWHPDGVRLAAGTRLGGCVVWDTEARKVLWNRSVNSTGEAVYGVRWSPNGTLLVSGHYPEILVWNESGGIKSRLAGHRGLVKSLEWDTDGTRLLSASEDQTAKIWNSTTGQELHSLNMHTVGVNVACWNPSEDSVLTVADSAKLSHLQVLGVLSTNLKTSNDSLKCVNWRPDGKLLGYSGRSSRRDV